MKLRVGHLDYVVRPYRDGDPGFGENYGFNRSVQQETLIDVDATPERQLATLLHEIAHAAWDAYAMPDSVDEEQAVTFFGNAFANIFRTNPHLLPVLIALRDGGSFVEQSE